MTDLTKITTPFGLLDEGTKEALRAHGGPYEWLNWGGEWEETAPPSWSACYAYRVKPQPPKPREWWVTGGNCLWNTRKEAEWANNFAGEIIHVREVL